MKEDFAPVGNFRKDDFALGEYGFPDDGYDYAQHFAPLGGGKWFAASAMGGVTAANRAAHTPATQEPSLVAPPPKEADFATPKVVVVKSYGRLQARDQDEQFADADSEDEVRRLLEQSDDDEAEAGGDLADDFIVAAMEKKGGEEEAGEQEGEGAAHEHKEPKSKGVSDRVRFADADFEDDEDEDESFHDSDGPHDDEDEDSEGRGRGGGRTGKYGVVQFEERVTGGVVDKWLDHLMENDYDDEQMGEGARSRSSF